MRMPVLSRRTAAGALVAALGAIGFYAALTGGLPLVQSHGGYLVRAKFVTSGELQQGDLVKVGGISVGTVERIDLADGGRAAVVSMRIANRSIHTKRDATASLRWRTPVGGAMFVDLDPGPASAPDLGAAVLGPPQTSAQVEFDDLTSTFSGHTQAATRNLLRQVGRGFSDPVPFRRFVGVLPPAMSALGGGLRPLLGTQPGDFGTLVSTANRTVTAIDRGGPQLEAFLDGGAATLDALAANRAAVGQTLESAPGTLDATVATLHATRAVLDRLDPLTARLLPAVRPLAGALSATTPTLRHAYTLLRDADPLLHVLPGAVDSVAAAGREGTALFAGLTPVLDRLASELLPFLAKRDPDTGLTNYETLGPIAAGVDAVGARFDNGGYITTNPNGSGTERPVPDAPCQGLITDPTSKQLVSCENFFNVIKALLTPNQPPS